jgi:acetylornithine/N-succinyldiaminopimelate aminotransferase
VVRLLPPLIVEEADLAEGIARLDRAATALERAAAAKPAKETAG